MTLRAKNSPCTKCRKRKPRTSKHYYTDGRTLDGLQSQCKACQRETQKRHYQANRETILPKARLRASIWGRNNPDRRRTNLRNWRRDNPERNLAVGTRYRNNNRIKCRVAEHRCRAQRANANGHYTAKEFRALLKKQRYRCFYCRANIRDWPTADHFIALARGGSNYISNIRAACRRCNHMKNDRPAEWLMNYLRTEANATPNRRSQAKRLQTSPASQSLARRKAKRRPAARRRSA